MSSYTKNEYNLFYQKLDAKYFLFNNFFKKNSIFWENSFKGAFDNLLEKGGVLHQKLT